MSNILFNILRCSSRKSLQSGAHKFAVKSTQLRPLTVASRLYVKSDTDSKAPSQKKAKELIKITLIQQNQLTVTTIEDAQKLARRRDLRLIKVQDLDPKSHRPVYRLVTPAELLAGDSIADSNAKKASTNASTKKSDKSLTIGSRIGDNDLASRLKNINKWLSKGHDVRILIQGGNSEDAAAEKVFEKIEAAIKEQANGKITQKRSKDGFIKFTIVPVRVNPEMSGDKA